MSVDLSVITACYNHGIFLQEMCQSVARSLENISYEHIIVNDGSTDAETLRQLALLEQKGLRVLHQENRGLAAARNAGIQQARGRYLLPMDCDNLLQPGWVSGAIDFLDQHPRCGTVYTDAVFIGEKKGHWKVGAFNLQRLMLSNYIDACALIRKTCWEHIGGYDESRVIMMWSDWDFWLRLAFEGYRFEYRELAGFSYRVAAGSMVHGADRNQYQEACRYFYTKHAALLGDIHLFTRLNGVKIFLAKYTPQLFRLLIRLGVIKNPYSLW